MDIYAVVLQVKSAVGPSIVTDLGRGRGGKGWNLGRLHRYGFRVPASAVLVADSYDRHLAVVRDGQRLTVEGDAGRVELG